VNVRALILLWNMTQRHLGTSGARAAAGVLLGLYNGDRFPMNLLDLRLLDDEHTQAALEVIRCDASRCEREVHEWLNHVTGRRDFGRRFEHLAHQVRAKGRCKREHLDPIDPPHLVIQAAADEPEPTELEDGDSYPAPDERYLPQHYPRAHL
jgi:hypothetical protein